MNSGPLLVALALSGALLSAPAARATGLATCESGGRDGWQAQEKLAAVLKDKGWQVRRTPVPTGARGHKG